MSRISMLIVRTSLVYLVAGTTIGSLLLALKGWPEIASLTMLRPFHFEFLLFGFMVQLAFGVASWILPRIASRSGNGALVAAIILLNGGILGSSVGDAVAVPAVLLIGRVLEVAAMGTFAWYIWPRVRSFRD